MKYLCYFAISVLAFPAFVKTMLIKSNFTADELLNTNFYLFPNVTINYHFQHEDDLVKRFRTILDDDELLNEAYENFQKKYILKGSQSRRSEHYNGHSRKQIFKDNLYDIFRHNVFARIPMVSKSKFEMGVNKFADMHIDEFKTERLGLVIPDETDSLEEGGESSYQSPHYNFTRKAARQERPINFDWRDRKVITSVKDQQTCGACVMFAMTSVIEARHALCNQNEFLDLSEQIMIDCAVRENGYKRNKGCDGNIFPDSLNYAIDHGIASEQQYPYQGKQGKCNFDGMRPLAQLQHYRRLKDNVDAVKDAVYYEGPVAIGMYVQKAFLFYDNGVYDQCGSPMQAVGGHAMAIVGFREESSPRPQKYYIIKNQWGEDWGEKGYVKYIHTDSKCGLEKLAYSLQIRSC